MKFLLTFLLLTFAYQITFGQENQKAELLDNIGPMGCDNLKMRTYIFLDEVAKDSNSMGYAVVYEKKGRKNRSSFNERLMMKTVELGTFNKGILKVVYGEERDIYGIEFWKVPNGAESPKYLREFLPKALPVPLKPFVFGYEDETDVCPTFSAETYVNILKANPSFNAHIVVNNNPNNIQENFVKSWLKYLQKDNSISRSRIKFFFTKKSNSLSYAEYWIVPKNKKS